MRYEDHLIDQVQSANDIVDIISQYIPLKRAGRNLKACCPFHEEKTPSFMVQPEKQIFHCFGCGVGGNVFSFLMKYENQNFPEAMRHLAERAHIDLPKPGHSQKESSGISEQLYEIYRLAAEFYHQKFMDTQAGKAARNYFESRKFDLHFAREMQIGWAPDAWRGLFEYLSKKGFSNELLLKSSLVHRSPKGNFYDAFRGRLLFPIHNLSGKVVAFGGRLIAESDGPKYLNSPENPIFRKRRELFGLYLAKRAVDRDQRRILVAEGYFDFLRLYQHGFKASVATLGTALTEDHVQLLKRFADEAIVVYDGDKAGEAASLRGLEVFLEGGMSVRVIRLPEGFDPDDLLAQKGNEVFEQYIENAQDFFDYKLETLLGRYDQKDSLGLMRITNEFLETLLKVQSPILLDRYLRRLAASLGVDETSLRSELSKLKTKYNRGSQTQTSKLSSEMPKFSREPETDVWLFSLMIDDASILEKAMEVLEEADFKEPWARSLFQIISKRSHDGQPVNLASILNRLQDEGVKQRLAHAISIHSNAEEKAKAFEDCLRTLNRKRTKGRMEEIRRNITKAEQAGDLTQVGVLTREYQVLLKQQTTGSI